MQRLNYADGKGGTLIVEVPWDDDGSLYRPTDVSFVSTADMRPVHYVEAGTEADPTYPSPPYPPPTL